MGIGKESVSGTTDFKNESVQLEVIKGTLNQYLLPAFQF